MCRRCPCQGALRKQGQWKGEGRRMGACVPQHLACTPLLQCFADNIGHTQGKHGAVCQGRAK